MDKVLSGTSCLDAASSSADINNSSTATPQTLYPFITEDECISQHSKFCENKDCIT